MLVTLDSITTKITKGTTPTSVGCTFENSGVNFIKSESLGNSRNIDRSKFAFISEQTHEKLKRSQIEKNDILFSMAGMFLGKTGIVTDDLVPANTNQAVAIIRIDTEKANHEYVYYYLNQRSVVQAVNASSAQSAQPNINLKQIGQIEIDLPERKLQDKIVSILSAIDFKIEKNNQINENLEQQARAVFQAWFIDYEPFGGVAPSAWHPSTLGQIAELKTDSWSPAKNPDVMVEHYSIPAFDEQHYPVFEIAAGIKSNKYILNSNSVMISKLNPDTKRIWRPLCLSAHSVCSTEFIVYEAKKQEQRDYIYSILDSTPFLNHLCSHTTGSTNSRQRTTPKSTLDFTLCLPPDSIIEDFCQIVTPMYDLIASNIVENQSLAKTRDSLLPRLMSGELDVSSLDI